MGKGFTFNRNSSTLIEELKNKGITDNNILLAIKKGMKIGTLRALTYANTGEVQGIKEAASACYNALKKHQKSF